MSYVAGSVESPQPPKDRTVLMPEALKLLKSSHCLYVSLMVTLMSDAIFPKPQCTCVYFKPAGDDGFRLYNPQRDCHLATTFRSIRLDRDSTNHNDSVHARMTGTLEASCTRLVSKSASTFWVIEGRLQHPRTEDSVWRERLPPIIRALAEILQRGCRILRAHVSLYRWQSRYVQQLELLLSPLAFSRVQERWESWVEQLILLLFLGNHSLFLLVSV